MITAREVLLRLKKLESPENVHGMRKFGINSSDMLGIPMPILRKEAKSVGKSHELALELWKTGIFEARLISVMIDEPEKVSEEQMDRYIECFDSWAICDVCMDLFSKTKFAWKKALEWSEREREYEKRAGFALMAAIAVYDKKANDSKFVKFFEVIKRESTDERTYVRKAVNWALRQIGKRNNKLNAIAIDTAKEIESIDSRSAKWIARDALKELKSEKIQERIKNKGKKI